MNLNKFHELAKEKGITKSQCIYTKSSSLNMTIFRGEIENYGSTSSSSLIARGIYNGKSGSGNTENISSKSFDTLIEEIKSTASILETKDDPIYFEENPKYSKKKVFSKELEERDPKDILAKLFSLEKILKTADSKVKDVQIMFQKETQETTFTTSKGLKLTEKANYYLALVLLFVEKDGVVKYGYDFVLSSNPNELDIQLMADKVLKTALSKLGEKPIKDGKYKAVLSSDAVGDLLEIVLSALNSEEVQKHSSFLEGKLNQQVFSTKLTVKELPLTKNVFFSYFDAEGVPTQNKTLIDKGVVKTYLYNLITAKKDGVQSTGNGSRRGSKIGIAYNNVFVKPGKLDQNALFEKVNNGVYITSVSGLHAGMNEKSGDFSLEAQGFLIKDGKQSTPLPLFTVSGNVFDIFKNVVAVGNDSKLLFSKITAPSLITKSIKISVS